jgi:hypothetical protein
MMNKFQNAAKNMDRLQELLAANTAIADKYYDVVKLRELSQNIFNILNGYISKNIDILLNWRIKTIPQRQQFISECLSVLLKEFPSVPMPKIHFLPKLENLSAAFYNRDIHKKYRDMAIKLTGNDETAFLFTGDLSENGIIGQIVHEFTHYLQSIGKSTIPYNIVENANAIYEMPFENAGDSKIVADIYAASILEKEAQYTGDFVRKQVAVMLQNNLNMRQKINNE